jgi:hypothetical protein
VPSRLLPFSIYITTHLQKCCPQRHMWRGRDRASRTFIVAKCPSYHNTPSEVSPSAREYNERDGGEWEGDFVLLCGRNVVYEWKGWHAPCCGRHVDGSCAANVASCAYTQHNNKRASHKNSKNLHNNSILKGRCYHLHWPKSTH